AAFGAQRSGPTVILAGLTLGELGLVFATPTLIGAALTVVGSAIAAFGAQRSGPTVILAGLTLGELGLVFATPTLIGLLARAAGRCRWRRGSRCATPAATAPPRARPSPR
ncbi:hypothetical protein, partial [Micromonospora sp. 4G55]|uniref:hypothetical protein n=1 Tax=Micromonospora sp. 4G55 TaxID=2806102 RepID=UPI001A381E90